MIIWECLVVNVMHLLLLTLGLSFLLEQGDVFFLVTLLMWRVIRCLISILILSSFLGILYFMSLCFLINLILVLLCLLSPFLYLILLLFLLILLILFFLHPLYLLFLFHLIKLVILFFKFTLILMMNSYKMFLLNHLSLWLILSLLEDLLGFINNLPTSKPITVIMYPHFPLLMFSRQVLPILYLLIFLITFFLLLISIFVVSSFLLLSLYTIIKLFLILNGKRPWLLK